MSTRTKAPTGWRDMIFSQIMTRMTSDIIMIFTASGYSKAELPSPSQASLRTWKARAAGWLSGSG
jgi:hypothetical protein